MMVKEHFSQFREVINWVVVTHFIILLAVACKNEQIEYYANGNIKSSVAIINSNKEGVYTEYYINGEKKIVADYIDGLKSGIVKCYDSLGNLKLMYSAKNGMRHGEYQEYYSNGQLQVDGQYVENYISGMRTEYYDTGEMYGKYYFEKDSMVYMKRYTMEGVLYDSFLPISIARLGNREYEVSLNYTIYDSVRIGVIIGQLDKNNSLIDTVSILGSAGMSVRYELNDIRNPVLSGVLYEIKMPQQSIEGLYYFTIPDPN